VQCCTTDVQYNIKVWSVKQRSTSCISVKKNINNNKKATNISFEIYMQQTNLSKFI